MSAKFGHEVICAALCVPSTANSHTGLTRVPGVTPSTSMVVSRQWLIPGERVLPTIALVPVTTFDQTTLVHLASLHTSTRAVVNPVGSAQVSVGVRVLTALPVIGPMGLVAGGVQPLAFTT